VLVKAGDTIKAEQSLITVESDKASMEIPASAGGVVKELKVRVGDKVAMGSVVLSLETGAAAATAAPSPAPTAAAPAPAATASASAPAPASPPRPAPAAVAAVGDGQLNLRASDTADVYLDGKKLGSSPLVGVKAKAGSHKVRFDCYDAAGNTIAGQVKVITVVANEELDVDYPCPESE